MTLAVKSSVIIELRDTPILKLRYLRPIGQLSYKSIQFFVYLIVKLTGLVTVENLDQYLPDEIQ